MWVTPDILEEAVHLVHGTPYFEKISCQFNPLEDGMQLVLNVSERPRTYIKGSIHYDNYYGIGIILGFSRHNILLKGTALNITGDISKYPQFRIDYNKYFGVRQNLYASIYATGDFSKLPVYENKEIVGVAGEDYFASGISLNYVFRTNNSLGTGLQYRLLNIRPDQALKLIYPILGFDRFGFHATDLRLQYEHNTLNSNLYPTSGTMASLDLNYVFTGKEYLTTEGSDSIWIEDARFDVKPSGGFSPP
jgi:NTE family protein